MSLPARAELKTAADKKSASLVKSNNIYTLLPATTVPSGHKIDGSGWICKLKAGNMKKKRVVAQAGG